MQLQIQSGLLHNVVTISCTQLAFIYKGSLSIDIKVAFWVLMTGVKLMPRHLSSLWRKGCTTDISESCTKLTVCDDRNFCFETNMGLKEKKLEI